MQKRTALQLPAILLEAQTQAARHGQEQLPGLAAGPLLLPLQLSVEPGKR